MSISNAISPPGYGFATDLIRSRSKIWIVCAWWCVTVGSSGTLCVDAHDQQENLEHVQVSEHVLVVVYGLYMS